MIRAFTLICVKIFNLSNYDTMERSSVTILMENDHDRVATTMWELGITTGETRVSCHRVQGLLDMGTSN